MLEVPVYNTSGRKIDTMKVDESVFGGSVNAPLLKQAVVTYHANSHQHSAHNRGRGDVIASTRKLFRQKGTGSARRGAGKTNIQRGGGVAFAKRVRSAHKTMPKRMRQAALNTAILAKIIGGDLLIVDSIEISEPKTARMVELLENLEINRSCLLGLAQRDRNVYLSARNIGDLTVRTADELNAYDVAKRQKMLQTLEAMKLLGQREGRS